MTSMLAILRRELTSTFFSPLAWILLSLFLLAQGYSFYLFMELASQPFAPHGAVMQYFFGGTWLYWLSVIFVISTITMRLLAEERRSGTIESLMTAPVSELQVVMGKYLAALVFYGFLWVPSLIYVALVAWLSDAAAAVAWGPVVSGYLGTLLVGASFISVGLLCSTLTKKQVIAAVLCFTLLTMFLLVGALEMFVSHPLLMAIIAHINLFSMMEDFSRGIVDSRHLVLHLCVVVFCLWAACKTLEVHKWR